jgi:hypothetical protein
LNKAPAKAPEARSVKPCISWFIARTGPAAKAPKALVFLGRRMLGAMDDCTDACVRGTRYEGEIESTVAIYKTYEPDAAG